MKSLISYNHLMKKEKENASLVLSLKLMGNSDLNTMRQFYHYNTVSWVEKKMTELRNEWTGSESKLMNVNREKDRCLKQKFINGINNDMMTAEIIKELTTMRKQKQWHHRWTSPKVSGKIWSAMSIEIYSSLHSGKQRKRHGKIHQDKEWILNKSQTER